jgi:ATP-binding cassette subfamily B protein/subfamily B ATP-binding cassette protein MsbA
LHAIALVKAFGRERYETERFETESSETLNESIRTARLEAGIFARSRHRQRNRNVCGPRIRLAPGFAWTHHARIAAGLRRVYEQPVRSDPHSRKASAKLSRAFVSAGRISETLGIEPEREDSAGAIEATAIRGDISFRHVSFEYGAGKPVLRNISFDIATGQKVALLGRSGAGKSTIISLLLRLYEIEDGAILIDGINVKDYKRESLRQQIAIVMQDSVMFGASVRENIAYGKVDATDEEIIGAAKAANAHEFISKLEDGYDTVIGERGGTLSGGQRQRIAIARAFVRSAPILVLDEPMTGLDVESEAAVRDALNRLMRGKTCLAITHDLASAATSDRVLILEDSQIVEQSFEQEPLLIDFSVQPSAFSVSLWLIDPVN